MNKGIRITISISIYSTIVLSLVMLAFSLWVEVTGIYNLYGFYKSIFYALPLILLMVDTVCLIKIAKTEEEKKKAKTIMLSITFIAYIAIIITLLLFSHSYRFSGSWKETVPIFSEKNLTTSLSIIPFHNTIDFIQKFLVHKISFGKIITNILGNLFLFAPFGFFIPLLWKNKINLKKFIGIMISIVTIMEVTQFFARVGVCDIDDIILNVLGAVCVYGIMHLKWVKKIAILLGL